MRDDTDDIKNIELMEELEKGIRAYILAASKRITNNFASDERDPLLFTTSGTVLGRVMGVMDVDDNDVSIRRQQAAQVIIAAAIEYYADKARAERSKE